MMVKIKFSNGRVNSLTHMLKYTKADKDKMISTVLSILELRSDDYTILPIDKIWVEYKIADYPDLVKPLMPILENKIDKLSFTEIKEFKLPNTMDITLWSDNIRFLSNTTSTFSKDNYNYDIKLSDKTIITQIKNIESNELLLEFTDTLDGELDTFTRVVNNRVFKYINGKAVYRENIKKVKFIRAINKSENLNLNIITMDLETRELTNSNLEVISSVFYNGKEFNTFYLADYNNSSEMIKDSLANLKDKKYHRYSIYIHNLSYFDGVFLLKHMVEVFTVVKPIIRDGRIISIKVYFGNKNKYHITFLDSLLLLPSSLSKLSKSFGVESKGEFDHNRSNSTNLNDILFREELLSYNKQDCKILYDILNIFSKEIFNMFTIDITRYPTLSSLAFAIYRSNFMSTKDIKERFIDSSGEVREKIIKQSDIPIITGPLYDQLVNAFAGGHVDVYKSFGENIYRYDVNSLYPSIMLNNPMPIGIPKYFEGERDLSELFGFVYVDIIAPDHLKVPVLLTKIKGKTIAPVGEWSGWYFTEELKFAQSLGYKITVKGGYLFEYKNIFYDYVNTLYNNRLTYDKSDPRNLICKLLMNCLFGRFGMNPQMSVHAIVEQSDLNYDKVKIIDRVEFDNGKKRSITFIDSLLLLNSKLDKLAKAFNVERKLDYDLTSLIEGTFIVNESNRKDLLNYNVQDCIVLHQVMCAFSNYIYELFKLDISKYPTLPSLAFAASHRFVKIIKGFTYNP